jgi:precorrin-6Y C5,15-methyltransferase (decarboxylating)
VAVFTDPKKNPAWLAGFLLSRGITDVTMSVFERLGAPEEKTGAYALDEAAGLDFHDPNMVILKHEPRGDAAEAALHLGMAEEVFDHERGLLTKTEIRAVTLAKLRLRPHHTFWDLGAGSGSVSVEAAVLLNEGNIFAVEQNPERVAHIRTNLHRFAVTNVDVIQAVLPKGIADLPAPDRVFVGGGGRQLDHIITAAAAALKPGGILVANTVLLANLQTAVNTLKALGFETESIQVQVNRSRAMPWSERFEAGNPVWIISGKKKES